MTIVFTTYISAKSLYTSIYVYIHMNKKTKLTLSIDKNLLDEYKKYCEKEGLIISRQVEKFMEEQIKKR